MNNVVMAAAMGKEKRERAASGRLLIVPGAVIGSGPTMRRLVLPRD